MTLDGLDTVLGLIYLLLGMYLTMSGILGAMASGFRFYLVARVSCGLPLLLSSLVLVVAGFSGTQTASFNPLVALGWFLLIVMFAWERKQQEKARLAFPVQWAAWEGKAQHDRPLKRFFYPGVVKPNQQQGNNNRESDASRNRAFWMAIGSLAVVGFIGLVLMLLIFLSRRGF